MLMLLLCAVCKSDSLPAPCGCVLSALDTGSWAQLLSGYK